MVSIRSMQQSSKSARGQAPPSSYRMVFPAPRRFCTGTLQTSAGSFPSRRSPAARRQRPPRNKSQAHCTQAPLPFAHSLWEANKIISLPFFLFCNILFRLGKSSHSYHLIFPVLSCPLPGFAYIFVRNSDPGHPPIQWNQSLPRCKCRARYMRAPLPAVHNL